MKKNISKFVSLLLVCFMVLGCTATAFAAEPDVPSDTSSTAVEENIQEIPIVFEGNSVATPFSQGERVDFALGSIGYMSNCGFLPKFKFWVTGGDANTSVALNVVTGGGVKYGPFGPVKANGSTYIEKQFVVYNGSGVWQFTAQVTSGNNNGKLVCHIEQTY
ncbi:MAG: hypothetical protein HFJ29_02345 [Clostridia bacterium]|nr:hypothetical protein [Clostridia bacterium]